MLFFLRVELRCSGSPAATPSPFPFPLSSTDNPEQQLCDNLCSTPIPSILELQICPGCWREPPRDLYRCVVLN